MKTLQELQTELQDLKSALDLKESNLTDLESDRNSLKLDNDDSIAEYEEMLDEVNGDFMGMDASYILKECDPIAVRCGLNDYIDAKVFQGRYGLLEYIKQDRQYKDLSSDIETLESDIEDLEIEIEEVEQQIEDFEE